MKFDTMLAGLDGRAGPCPPIGTARGGWRLHVRGPPRCVHPSGPGCRCHDNLELATNVAIAFPRNPVQLAHQAYDLQLLSGGRFTLGLGSQIRTQVEKRYGASFDRPVARMREMVGALRAIFATWETGEALDFQGEFWSHTLMPPLFNPGPNPHGPPPIALGGLGPQMLRLAAEVGDGVLVMPFNTATHFMERSLPAIEEGLARGGRDRSSFTVTGEVIVCCGQNEEELEAARSAGRWLLSFYASTPAYRPVLEAEGWEALQPELNSLSKSGRWDEMPGLIDDDMLAASPRWAHQGRGPRHRRPIRRPRRSGGLLHPYLISEETLAEVVTAMASVVPNPS